MSDLISRQAAIEAVMNHYRVDNKPQNEEMDWCAKMLSGLPTAEKKGKWVCFANEGGELDLRCSVCGEEQGFFFGYFNYCPNCGARMEEE